MSSNHNGKITKLFEDQLCCAWEIDDYCFCARSDQESFSSEFKMEDNDNNCSDTVSVLFDHEEKCFYHSYFVEGYGASHISCQTIQDLKLTVFCKIKNIQLTKYKKNKFDGLSKDFEWLYKNEQFSDVIIVVGEKQFHAHKAILASRSAVFLDMFKNEMKENKIDIIDIDKDVIQEVLRFVYTGKIENHNIVIGILAAAEKYAIEDLKIECSEILSDNIKIDNVYEILALAYSYNMNDLKKATIDFIAVHANELVTALGSIAISDS